VARPVHHERHPVHVTLRAVRRLASLRKQVVYAAMLRAFSRASREWFRIVHFSVQADHVHLIVEADDREALSRGASGLSIRLARAVNSVLVRHGRVWSDRYHARPLRTPREVRHGLVYVLMNWKKHVRGARGFDVCASAFWFDGWTARRGLRGPPDSRDGERSPVVRARTWLGSRGWRRHGLIDAAERPRAAFTT
jgi:REP element-mobilizing transposase RayT